MPRPLVIGIGNLDRGDDGVGRAVAQWLRGKLPPEIEIMEHDGEATMLLAAMQGAEAVYLIDACVSGAAPGTVRRFDVVREPMPQHAFSLSSHGLGLGDAIELARMMDQLPPRCIVFAIEARGVHPGAEMSPEVAAAVARAGEMVRMEFSGDSAPGGRHDA